VIVTRPLLCRILLGRTEPAVIDLMQWFALAMVPVGIVQALGFNLLAARRYRLCFVLGGCGLAYGGSLLVWGTSPGALLSVMTAGAIATLVILAAVAGLERLGGGPMRALDDSVSRA